MQILIPLSERIEDLLVLQSQLAPVDRLRPGRCPLCSNLARSPERTSLGIVGHGCYLRQVRGLLAPSQRDLVIAVRRYQCLRCRHTTSVLPDWLHPRYGYGAWVILEALLLFLIFGFSQRELIQRFKAHVEGKRWRSLGRWGKHLLDRLWGWLRLCAPGPAQSKAESKKRLARLLAQAGEGECRLGAGLRAAPRLLTARVYALAQSWPVGQPAPEEVSAKLLS